MKTFIPNEKDVLNGRKWFVVDLDGKVLGRQATEIATILRGKHKPSFTPFFDCGDHIVVINAEKVALTGRKWQQKKYYRHSGYPGGLRELTAEEVREKHPERLIRLAVKRMLPKGPLGRQMIRKLKIYAGPEHPHSAQSPELIEF